jgi:phosphatidylinositol-3-phosphatase
MKTPRRSLGIALVAALLILVLGGAAWLGVRARSGGTPAGGNARAPGGAATPTSPGIATAYAHVFVVLMENQGYGSVVGSASAPYLNETLIPGGALAANYHAIAHPSLPNYLDLVAAQSAGITTDCSPGPRCTAGVAHLGDRLESAGRSWKAYQESMPAPCTARDASPYAVRHDPFVYFDDVRRNASRCAAHVVPLSQLGTDVARGDVPTFAFVTPNVHNDMHDGTVEQGDTWLRQHVPELLGVPASLVIVTWDEAEDGGQANRVPAIFAGPGVAAGSTSGDAANHYSLLRTIESVERVAPLTTNDRSARVMTEMFTPRPGG